jgi:hypothetical protein
VCSRLNSSGSEQGIVVGSSEHGNELSCSIKGGEFLEYLSDHWPLQKSL